MDYEFPMGLVALAGIIPLVIVYLLKPRPKPIILPSLMFVRNISRNSLDSRRKPSKKITDPLFFLQLLALILMAFVIAGPLLENITENSERVVVIIDSSASMAVPDRIEAAKSIAIECLGKENTVIAAESMPVVLAKAIDAASAEEIINDLESKDTSGEIPEAILTVVNDEGNQKAKIVVISDFENWAGKAPETYMKIARAKNMELEFRQVGKATSNYAIIGGYLKDQNDGTYEYTCTVKNFNNESVKLDVQLESKSGLISTQKISKPTSLGEFGTQQIKFSSIPQGISTVEILNKDSVSCDNTAWISIPEIRLKQMLILTDLDPAVSKSPLITALSLMPGLKVDVQHDLPADDAKYDTIEKYDTIVIDCEHEPLPASTIKKVVSYAQSGKDLIVIGNGCLYNSSEMHELYPVLPVEISSIEEDSSHTIETTGSGTQIFEGISFNDVYTRKYLAVVPRENALVLAELEGAGPVVCTWKINNGTATYVGISNTAGNEAWNNFPTVPTYPVFWAKLLKYLWGIGDISETNVNTGRYQAFDQNVRVKTPGETISNKFVYYDKCGLYELNQKTIAANLYDSTESNTFTENRLNLTGESKDVQKEDLYTKSPDKFRKYLIYTVLLLLILENVVMFRRRII
ncbi:vWA domain-containing protein [Methanosarcina sp. UBA289]|uniref:vWA domain-containing protein n=1 Tax=Methanosarcina sp. UBA289 TaxID=1915574 RepID=UPI0025CDBBF6|nr:VWA domain-containing protein [Methanosarcina sp. UBA289]